jgi:hypothetical protein
LREVAGLFHGHDAGGRDRRVAVVLQELDRLVDRFLLVVDAQNALHGPDGTRSKFFNSFYARARSARVTLATE